MDRLKRFLPPLLRRPPVEPLPPTPLAENPHIRAGLLSLLSKSAKKLIGHVGCNQIADLAFAWLRLGLEEALQLLGSDSCCL